ncbi:uncharacterized protein LOC135401048 [Ornithodoros turicata]|uniref:uncharacterized protein LOC135401048 n=1 Tax=Ornithodoros turicata TaxID=34597 RepID=UPI003139A387
MANEEAAAGTSAGGTAAQAVVPAGQSGAPSGPCAEENRPSAESVEPPERRAQLLVTMICAVILVMVFSMIIYRMANEKPASQKFVKSSPTSRALSNDPSVFTEMPVRATTKGLFARADQTTSTGGTNRTPSTTVSTTADVKQPDAKPDDQPPPQGRMFRRRSSARELICVVTEMTTQQDQYPGSYCTHLIYSDVVYDPKHRKFLATKNDKSFELFRRNQRSANMSHLVALNPHQTLNVYLNGLTDMEVQWYFVQMIESLLSDYRFDGVSFIGIELSLENTQQFSRVIDKLKEALKKKPSRQFFQIIFGGFISDIDSDAMEVANRLRVIAEDVDIFIIETHYQRPLPLCKTVFPSAYGPYGSFSPSVPMSTGLNWIKAMQLPHNQKAGRNTKVCLSISMVALLFKISGTVDHLQPGNPCFEEIWMNYAETCIGHGWSNVKTHPTAMSSFRHKIKFWQSFDTDSSVSRKVELVLDQANKTCVAAYYVDYEDYYGMCQNKVAFPRLKAVREVLNKKTNLDEDIDLFGHEF